MHPSVSDVQHSFGISWGRLVELEPELENLLQRVGSTGGSRRTVADQDRVFGPLRNELASLVGFARKHRCHPILSSAEAYEVAYWVLYDAVKRSLAD
jgi:hypothetical protein